MTATQTRKRTAKANKRAQLTQELGAMKLLGNIVTWTIPENYGKVNSHKAVVDAMLRQGFDPKKYVKEFSYDQAFARAAHKMERISKDERREIEIIREDDNEILFQFSRPMVEDDKNDHDKKIDYTLETKVLLNLNTGELTCKNRDILEQARTKLSECMEARTTNDISNIVNRLFLDNADLIPIGLGTFFVPQEFSDFVDRMRSFLRELNRDLRSFPVPAGTQTGDQSVQQAVEEYLSDMVTGLMTKVDDFSLTTRSSTLEATATAINVARAKMRAYAQYLGEKAEELLVKADEADTKLAHKVEQLEEERKTAPPSEQGSNRQRVFAQLSQEPKTVHELCDLAGTNANGIKAFLEIMVQKGKARRIGQGYALTS